MVKQVLITGSSRGIGKAAALYLAKNNYEIVLHCNKNTSKAEEVLAQIEKLGSCGRILQFDISDRDSCRKVLEEDIQKNGVYYGIVLNAGITRDNIFPLMNESEWDDVLNTNLGGFYNVLKPSVFPMIQAKNGGRIVAMSSIAALAGNRGQVNYAASKAGLIGAVKALGLELAKRKITVNCIAPGVIETNMIDNLPLEEMKKMIPMKRLGKPEEIASLVNYLMSEDAGYITGQVISVNGGLYS